jgi:hypothetical protein
MADTDRRTSFVRGLRALADFYEHTDFPLPDNLRSTAEFAVFPMGAERLTELTLRLGGNRTKHFSEQGLSVSRDFGGGVVLKLFVMREDVCERVQVGTEMVVESDVTCVHCATPIRLDERYVWQHVDAEQGEYIGCDGTTSWEGLPDYEVGNSATPPSFEAKVIERPIYETRCPDSILDDGQDYDGEAVDHAREATAIDQFDQQAARS